MQYARMYTAPDGTTHFEDLPTDLPLVEAVPGNPPIGLSKALPASAVRFCSLPDGWTSSYHPSPQGGFSVILAGALECTVSDGEARRFGPGELVASDDVAGQGHRDRAIGDVLIMLVVMDPAAKFSNPA
jgi:hypothetical protein